MQRVSLVQPQSIEAEMCVLGSMIIHPKCIAEVIQILPVEAFYRNAHRLIYGTIIELSNRRIEGDIVAVKDQLVLTARLKDAGGYDYLGELVACVPNAVHAPIHAQTVHDKFLLRRLVSSLTGILRTATEGAGDPRDLLEQVQSQMLEISSDAGSRRRLL